MGRTAEGRITESGISGEPVMVDTGMDGGGGSWPTLPEKAAFDRVEGKTGVLP